jgi:hyperosmotically inducible protein
MSVDRFVSQITVSLKLAATALCLCAVAWAAAPPPQRPVSSRAGDRLMREVRHELVMLPYYGVFDNLAYRINGDEVELFGQVTRPTLKTDAERAVKSIEGVERVVNHVEVLPLSPMDDEIRLAAYRAIYGNASLNRYALAAVPSVHIIVKNGNVILEGVVATEMDRNLAEIQSKSVPNVFGVTNNLRVEK